MAVSSPRASTTETARSARSIPTRPRRLLPGKKLLFAVHGWLGLSLGLPLFVICFSGALAVVSHEIDWLLTPALRAPIHEGPVNWGAVAEQVRQRYPEGRLTLLAAPVGQGFAAQAWVDTPEGRRRVFADPASGQVTGETGWFNTQRFFRDFHRRFFWMSAWGITLVSSFSIVLLFSVGTGLLFYKRWWAKLFTLRPHKGTRVLWSDLHRMTGVWTLLFAAVIAATGFWYLVERPASRLLASRDTTKQSSTKTAPASTGASSLGNTERAGTSSPAAQGPFLTPLPVDEYVRIAADAYPELTIRSIWFPTDLDDPVRVEGQAEAYLVRDRANKILIDPYRGDVRSIQKAEDLAAGVRWIETADPLHFGDFGGLASKLIWLAFGLLLSALMPTGVYLWLKRAEQAAIGIAKRLDSEPDTEVTREIRRATRRRTGVGLVATTAILAWASVTTYQALARQQAKPAVVRADSPPFAIGPWTASAFREGDVPRAGKAAIFGLQFDLRSGHPNYRRASLAISETLPTSGWQRLRNGPGPVKTKLVLPADATGRERLWVAIEGWDGASYRRDVDIMSLSPRGATASQETWLEALGGAGVVAVCGAFVLLIVVSSIVWCFAVWIRSPRPRAATHATSDSTSHERQSARARA